MTVAVVAAWALVGLALFWQGRRYERHRIERRFADQVERLARPLDERMERLGWRVEPDVRSGRDTRRAVADHPASRPSGRSVLALGRGFPLTRRRRR